MNVLPMSVLPMNALPNALPEQKRLAPAVWQTNKFMLINMILFDDWPFPKIVYRGDRRILGLQTLKSSEGSPGVFRNIQESSEVFRSIEKYSEVVLKLSFQPLFSPLLRISI